MSKFKLELPNMLCLVNEHSPQYMTKIKSPADVYIIIQNIADHLDENREHLIVISMDTKNQIKSIDITSIGTLNANIVHSREIFYTAICHRSASIIIAHNHPSGDPTPSKEDIAVTEKLMEAGKILGIDLLDHVITGKGRYCSLKDEGFVK